MKKAPTLILVAIIAVLLILLQCNKSKVVKSNPVTYTVVEHHTDTIVDTVYVSHTNLVVNTIIKTERDTVIEYHKQHFSEYHFKINDSLLDGVIVATSPFKPEIDFNYTLKQFTIQDSTIVEKKEQDYKGFLYGGEVTISPLLNELSFGLGYQTKHGDLFELDYGRNFNDKYNVLRLGYKKRF